MCFSLLLVRVSYEEEDTCVSYGEEDTCVSYGEEDTCVSYGEEDTCVSYGEEDTCDFRYCWCVCLCDLISQKNSHKPKP